MGYCIISGCKNFSGKQTEKCRYYSFPKDKDICKKWIAACGDRKPFKAVTAQVCSEHFTEQDFRLQDILLKVPPQRRRLKHGVVPSRNLPETDVNEIKFNQPTKKYVFKEERIQKLLEECQAPAKEDGLNIPARSIKTKNRVHAPQTPPIDHSYTQISSFKDRTTQTEIDYECSKEFHIMRLESENKKLVSVIKKQNKRAEENEKIRTSLERIMTTGQINRLIFPSSQSKWSAKDIIEARALYSAGPEVYKLLKKKNYPIPGLSTLRGWVGKIDVKPGKLTCFLKTMKKMNLDDQKDRLCMLSFGKLKLRRVKGLKFAHVVMVVGLAKNWSHVVYYDFDIPTSFSILKDLIVELNYINFIVTAVISDFPLVSCEELGITAEKPFFINPSDESKTVFYFIDVLQIVRLLWKRFIIDGFLLDKKQVSTLPIKEIIDFDKLALPISHEHLCENKLEREETNLAVKFFSSSIFDVIRTYWYIGGIQTINALECADVIEVISNWFQVFNPKYTVGYGLEIETQNHCLALMSDRIGCLMPTKKDSLLRNAIHINNSALPLMLEYISNNYNIKQIETSKINHEHLQAFFDVIRVKCGFTNNPTALEFKYRLRCFLLNNYVN